MQIKLMELVPVSGRWAPPGLSLHYWEHYDYTRDQPGLSSEARLSGDEGGSRVSADVDGYG